jgi:hypothetical protein
MDRELMVLRCALWSGDDDGSGGDGGSVDVVVANVHLESMAQAWRRRQQLLETIADLSLPDAATGTDKTNANNTTTLSFIVGDFNFDCRQNFVVDDGEPLENNVVSDDCAAAGFADVWPALRSREHGATFDVSVPRASAPDQHVWVLLLSLLLLLCRHFALFLVFY